MSINEILTPEELAALGDRLETLADLNLSLCIAFQNVVAA